MGYEISRTQSWLATMIYTLVALISFLARPIVQGAAIGFAGGEIPRNGKHDGPGVAAFSPFRSFAMDWAVWRKREDENAKGRTK